MIALLLTTLTGCVHWRATSLDPVGVIEAERPRVLRVTLADGRVMRVADPVVAADSITTRGQEGPAHAAVADVRGIEVRRISATRTLAALVVHATVVVGAISLILAAQPHYKGF